MTEKPEKAEKSEKAKSKLRKYLVIVESPTKEKTISRFLDAGYTVKSSFGHVRDLPKDELGVEDKKDFAAKYVPVERAKKIIAELNAIAKHVDTIYLATDPDREGEAISWHLKEVIKAGDTPFKRISFHEITKTAIAEALKTPRDLDMALVNAQQARRIIDRLVGYKLSPLLWSKIKSGLSAGRVQSVAVRLIAERAKEIAAFKEEDYYTLNTRLAKVMPEGDKSGYKDFDSKLVRWEGSTVEQTVLLKLFADDPVMKPFYGRLSEWGVPVGLHTGMNFSDGIPMEYGDPMRLDRVACEFPKLRIIACPPGFPWVNQL
ncbi:MAG TPA: toprim domain-containing protein, partial [Elusimicrobiales bacterium]|nr:toprim domain-containing protein [Elusimicrobiales bacterium]